MWTFDGSASFLNMSGYFKGENNTLPGLAKLGFFYFFGGGENNRFLILSGPLALAE